jgi:NADH:ubiquinone oxidoreductase subunit 6 (subunit J)
MNWDAIRAIAELAGAVGVLFSIIYLAMQVKNNTEENKTHRNQSLIAGVADVSAQIASDPSLSEIVRKGMIDFESLDENDQFRFSFLFFSFMTKYDFSFH